MAIYNIIASNSINTAAGDGLSLASGDAVTVFSQGHILTSAAGMTGLVMAGSSQAAIHGQVFGPNMGIFAQGTGVWTKTITIGETGLVQGQNNGIRTESSDTTLHVLKLQNAGQIYALGSTATTTDRASIFANRVALEITNSGTIGTHPQTGYSIYSLNSGNLRLDNLGLISGDIRIDTNAGLSVNLLNSGTIAGNVELVSQTGAGTVVLSNSGTFGENFYVDAGIIYLFFSGGTVTGATELKGDYVEVNGTNAHFQFIFEMTDSTGVLKMANMMGTVFDFGLYSYAATSTLDLTGVTSRGEVATYNGNDWLSLAGARVGSVMTFSGNDTIIATDASALGSVELGAGDDLFEGGSGRDRVYDQGGYDEVSLGAGNDRVHSSFAGMGEADDDTLDGGEGVDWIDAHLEGWVTSDAQLYISLAEGVLTNRVTPISFKYGYDRITGFENVSGGGAADFIGGDTKANVLRGNGGADTIQGEGGSDTIRGNAGQDWIVGGTGRDWLTGGSDADGFVFWEAAESGGGALTRDVITDFDLAQDYIHLLYMDADTGTAGNQNFTFLGQVASGGVATVRFSHVNGNTLVEANIDADNASEFSLLLVGLHNLTASNFTL